MTPHCQSFFFLFAKKAFLPRSCDSDSAVKYKKTVKLSNLMVNFQGQPISKTLSGFTHIEKSFIHSMGTIIRDYEQYR